MSNRYIFLDGMRGIAALVVLAVHTSSIFELPALFANGELAVDFFFCLSGFVVANAYDSKIITRDFTWLMKKRIIRLYPMIVFAIILSAALAFIENKANVLGLSAAALVLFPISLITGGVLAFPLNLPMWSLFFEFVGSIGYGIERNRLSNKMLFGVVAISGGVLAATMFFGDVRHFGVGGRAAFLVGVARLVYPFALGMLLARLPALTKEEYYVDWYLAILLIVLFAIPITSHFYSAMCVLVLLPTLVFIGTSTDTPFPKMWEWLGRISYPLYLIHVPILEVSRYLFAGWSLWFVIPLAITVIITASVAALVLYDEPVRKWFSNTRRWKHTVEVKGVSS